MRDLNRTPWTPEEEAKLVELRGMGLPILSIIPLMREAGYERSYDAIENKLRKYAKPKIVSIPPPPPVADHQTPERYQPSPTKYESFTKRQYELRKPLTKVAALFDSHYPHHIPVEPFLRFLRDFQPDVFVFGGDNYSMDVISHWQEQDFKNIGMDNIIAQFNKEIDGLKRHLALFLDAVPSAHFVYLIGNHELWLEQFTQKFPQIADATFERLLGKIGEKIEFVPHGGFYQIGKLWFCHGDQFGTENPPKQALARTGKNVVFGHWHSHKQWPQFSMIDESERHQAIQVPCYAKLAPSYLKGRPHDWSNGFFTACIKDSGNFSPFVQGVSPDGNFISQAGVEYTN